MGELPSYVSVVFILTTFASIGFLLQGAKAVGLDRLSSRLLIFVLALWIFFQGALATSGFYLRDDLVPPRLILFAILPAVAGIAVYFIFFRKQFIERLPLKLLTISHIVRIPVELCLYWLFTAGLEPQMMTFEGRNFDILSGLLAPVVYVAAFRNGTVNRGILIAYNIVGLVLLANVVTIAALSTPSPIQQLNFDVPNRGVLLFPYIWLPAIVVPIVLFSHLASVWQLVRRRIEVPLGR
jgi:hypothetical protein